MTVAVGVDLVHIPSFDAQLQVPGSQFARVFSPLELRHAAGRRPEHLAGRWAAKEAFIKAWSQALYGTPPVMDGDAVDFAELEVRPDAWGRVAIVATGTLEKLVSQSLGNYHTSLSISHDGDYAMATVILTRSEA